MTEVISLSDGATIHIHTLGRSVRVTAIATSVEEANVYLMWHRSQSVIASLGNDSVILIAETEDEGTKLPKGFGHV